MTRIVPTAVNPDIENLNRRNQLLADATSEINDIPVREILEGLRHGEEGLGRTRSRKTVATRTPSGGWYGITGINEPGSTEGGSNELPRTSTEHGNPEACHTVREIGV
jgi:hypothetical protein